MLLPNMPATIPSIISNVSIIIPAQQNNFSRILTKMCIIHAKDAVNHDTFISKLNCFLADYSHFMELVLTYTLIE